jgi:hypothetical protein
MVRGPSPIEDTPWKGVENKDDCLLARITLTAALLRLARAFAATFAGFSSDQGLGNGTEAAKKTGEDGRQTH